MELSLILIGCLLLVLLGCSAAVRPHDPVGVVKAEIEVVDKGQVDVASSYFSDDAQIVTAWGQQKAREKIRAFMFNLVQMKEHDDIINLVADGTNVTGRMTLADTALKDTPVNLKAVVEDGKITRWEEGSAAK
jgi:hypothetical protein